LVALGWLGQPRVALSVWGGIAVGVTTAAVLGVTLPNLLRLARLDPHLAAGPVALAITDVLTLTFYFRCAMLIIS
jgi:magnesium transporter